MDEAFLHRNVNEGFQVAKRNEMRFCRCGIEPPRYSTNSASTLMHFVLLAKESTKCARQNAVLLVTHYQRLLDIVKPDFTRVGAW